MILAVSDGSEGIVTQLLESSAEVHRCNSRGLRAIDVAICSGHADIVRLLLQWGSSSGSTVSTVSVRESALALAQHLGNSQMVDLLSGDNRGDNDPTDTATRQSDAQLAKKF